MQSKSSSDINQEQIEQLEYAQKRINQKKNLYYNFVLFLFASVICLTLDHIFSVFGNVYFLNYSWSFWIIFIWFFALLFHVFNVYVTNKFINNSWVKKQKAKLINLQKMKIENLKNEMENESKIIAESELFNKKNQLITIIVAAAENNIIGNDNKLIWHLSDDLKRFKELTKGHHVIMGRKTFESIGRPLPNRINFIVSTTITEIEGAQVFKSTEEALSEANKLCIELNYEEIVIIGGGYLFRDTLSIVNKLVLTEVDCEIDGDVYYPDIDLDSWQNTETSEHKKDSENEFDFKVLVYEKIK